MHPDPASGHRPPATTLAALGAALISAVIRAATGLAFMILLAAGGP